MIPSTSIVRNAQRRKTFFICSDFPLRKLKHKPACKQERHISVWNFALATLGLVFDANLTKQHPYFVAVRSLSELSLTELVCPASIFTVCERLMIAASFWKNSSRFAEFKSVGSFMTAYSNGGSFI